MARKGLPARDVIGSHPKGRSGAEEPRSGLTADHIPCAR